MRTAAGQRVREGDCSLITTTRMTQATQKTVRSALHFARPVRANLMYRRPIDHLLGPEGRFR
jgi:hypothetical protein